MRDHHLTASPAFRPPPAGAAVTVAPLAVLQRRTLRVLAAAQVIGAMGLSSGATAGSLLAEDVTGGSTASGLPLAFIVLGSTAGAVPIGRLMDRAGRRPGLGLAFALGAGGAGVIVAGAAAASLLLLLAGCALFGTANLAVMLARYAAADLSPAEARGRAMGAVVFAGGVGSVAGPNLLAPAGALAEPWGLPDAAGIFLVAVLAFAAAAAILLVRLRPDPLLVRRSQGPAERLASGPGAAPASRAPGGERPALVASLAMDGRRPARAADGSLLRLPGLAGALAVMTAASLVMVSVMAVAPLHLEDHGRGAAFVGFAVSLHIAAMFGPAPLAGWLADRLGWRRAATVGAALLTAGGVAGALADPVLALVLLGLGWSAALVAGSARLAEAAPDRRRPQAEAAGEVAQGIAAGLGAAGAGALVGLASFGALCVAATAISALLLAGVAWRQ